MNSERQATETTHLLKNMGGEKEEIMDEGSEEIVFESQQHQVSDDNSDLSPEELESIRELSQKLGLPFDDDDDDDDDDSVIMSSVKAPLRRGRDGSNKSQVRYLSQLSELSQLASTRDEENTDNGIMARTLSEVGTHGYGLIGVSVWLLEYGSDKLVPRGWWRSQSMPNSAALDKLFDPSDPNYVPQKPVLPGVDLAGILWNESSKDNMAGGAERRKNIPLVERVSFVARSSFATAGNSNRSSSFFFGNRGSTVQRDSTAKTVPTRYNRRSSISSALFTTDKPEEVIKWRDLKSLVIDPYTAKGPRLALLEKAGFHKAAGVTFNNAICQGIVIYYVANDLDNSTLNSIANASYLIQSAQMIGSCISMVKTRRATEGQKIKRGLSQRNLVNTTKEIETSNSNNTCSLIPSRVKKLRNKIKGGGLQIPPSPNITHVSWTLFGTFTGFLLLSSVNEYTQHLSDDELFLILGPFGALLTLQYGLTAAPASQPRNAIFGQALAGATAMAFTYIPETILPVWIRQVMGPAVAISLMVKCGFTHPPGGAHAVILSSGKFNWGFYAIGLLGTILSIIPAIIVNNLSEKRQYPTYWGFVTPKWQKDLTKIMKQMASKKRKESPMKQLDRLDSSSDNEEEV